MGRKNRKRSVPAEAQKYKFKDLYWRRRASFCCIRDRRSRSLFGLVDRVGIGGRTVTEGTGPCAPRYSEAERQDFEDECSRLANRKLKEQLDMVCMHVYACLRVSVSLSVWRGIPLSFTDG